MANIIEGFITAKDMKVGIVVARFNEFITSKLLGGALDALHRHEAKDEDIDVAWVPGAFEIPVVAKKMAESGKYDAVIALGAVIRGSTTHYDYVCNEVSKGVAQVGMQTGVPTIFGVVTTEGCGTRRHEGRQQGYGCCYGCYGNGKPAEENRLSIAKYLGG